MKKNRKMSDSVAFMRKRYEELYRAYAGPIAEETEERVKQSLKDSPLWRRHPQTQAASASRKKSGDRH